MLGIANQAFNEVERKLSQHSLQISLKFKDYELNGVENGVQSEMVEQDKELPKKNCNYLGTGRSALEAFISKHRRIFKRIGFVLLNLFVLVYLTFAILHWQENTTDCKFEWCNGVGLLLLIVGFSYYGIFYYWILKKYFGKSIRSCFQPAINAYENLRRTKYGLFAGKTILYLIISAAIISFLIFDTVGSSDRWMSFIGVVVLMGLGWIFSKHPEHINWRPVIWGLLLQFTVGLFTIRWPIGREICQCIADRVTNFFSYAKDGARFVFADGVNDISDNFAFSVFPVIIFFSFIVQILYYLGVMQWIVLTIGSLLQFIMGTTICESVNSVANTFLGMTESPLLIKPYIKDLTASEIHSIMCSGFATVSGSTLAAFIGYGAQASHLITASVMSAPAALCYSKLFYPEVEKCLVNPKTVALQKSEDTGILDAASKGALAAIPLVLGIIFNIIAFISMTFFLNAILSWLGGLVGYELFSFELILSKVFIPLSWVIGVRWEQCEDVATLIGLKVAVNEFVAYQKLGEFKAAGRLYGRAEVLATYAICGFANPGSVAVLISGLSALAPEKREQITNVAVRAFIAGNAVCFLTACIAGILMDDDFHEEISTLANSINTTDVFVLT